jgi:hypothetical protein
MPVPLIHPLAFLAGQTACLAVRQVEKVSSLSDVEFRVTSQFGQDGIIEWLIHWLGVQNRTFIEIGASQYNEAQTRFLLENRNWRGLLIDADPRLADVNQSNLMWRHDISVVQSFVTADNIDTLIKSANFGGEIGLLFDIDGNDYWVWRAIRSVNPVIVICEYNAVLGDLIPAVVPYNSDFDRTQAHPSNIYWGASINALVKLALEKGYQLVGTDSVGINAFFVHNDFLARVGTRIKDTSPRPSLNRTPRSEYGGGYDVSK